MQINSENSRFIVWQNNTLSTVPAHGIIRITGADTTTGVATGGRPSRRREWLHAVNGLSEVGPGQRGLATFDFPTWAKYDSANTPVVGELWQPSPGQFLLKRGKNGSSGNFPILGAADGDLVLVGPPYCRCGS